MVSFKSICKINRIIALFGSTALLRTKLKKYRIKGDIQMSWWNVEDHQLDWRMIVFTRQWMVVPGIYECAEARINSG